MTDRKHRQHGVSWGLSEVGYDLRTKQKIEFVPPDPYGFYSTINNEYLLSKGYFDDVLKEHFFGYTKVFKEDGTFEKTLGRTALASSVEEFDIPLNLWGELRNKSTLARQFIDATIGTDIEPGWKGFLTIEVIFHGNKPITIPAGSGIAKAVFHELRHMAEYKGKYQYQPDEPVLSKFE
ncbi:hypothetical protein KIP58_21910 [Xanthomonas campestris pv. campestris]|nr:hypothetical protein [Xanthomonas campestris]MCF8861644.1 hypothetical protein [Xanthomonas campestris pv. campestris]